MANSPTFDQRDTLIRIHIKKSGLRGKVYVICIDWINHLYEPGIWLKQVENCTSRCCPLYTVRPLPIGSGKT